MSDTTEILKIKFNKAEKSKILEEVTRRLKTSDKKIVIVTPNPELVVLAYHDEKYKTMLNSANFSLPDGVGIVWASRILQKGVKERVAGVDFMKSVCEKISKQPVTIGLFGSRGDVAVKAAECLVKMYPGLQISYASNTWDLRKAQVAKIDVLFVALGSPKQEEWIHRHLEELPVKAVMGVGGAFDMISGKVRRAPGIFQSLGLEWLWRLIQQPWRWKRQIRLIEFMWLVLLEKIKRTR